MTTISGEAAPYPIGPPDRLAIDPSLAALRADNPVLRVRMPYGGDGWLVTRHADIKTVLSDRRFSLAAAAGRDVPRSLALQRSPSSILGMDPPQHSRLRRLVAQAFTMRQIENLRPRVHQIVDELVDTMVDEGGPVDLAAALTWPMPITVICELLGVPMGDRDTFRAWADRLLILSGAPEVSEDAMRHLMTYIGSLAARRRTEPSDDLLGVLVAARDNDDRLSDEELAIFGVTLLGAGHETTANQTGNIVYTVLANRRYWDELVANPDLIPAAVEELLRVIPLNAATDYPRIATEDLELAGRHIRAGDAVVAVSTSANRDAAVFDRPDEIDFHRANNPHLAFGYGPHHCLGAQLARMEMRTAIAILIRRLPGLRLAVPAEQVPWRTNQVARGVTALPVTW